MTVIETPAIHHRSGGNVTDHHRLSSKRKRDDDDHGSSTNDDDEDDLSRDLVSYRMRKEEPRTVNSCSPQLQFFVRMMNDANSMVMQALPEDTVKSIHERIQTIKGIPLFEQRLIYWGKQLQCEQTLAECGIQKDANLQLVGRMRSTEYPRAWQAINDMVSLVYRLCRGQLVDDPIKIIKRLITCYNNMAPKSDRDSATGYFQILLSSSAPAVLVMLYMSSYPGNKECADHSVRYFMSSCRSNLSKSLHNQCAPVVLEFCKLLRSRVGCHDPLYFFCRSTFGSLLENAGVSYGADMNVKGGLISIQDIFPFVRELCSSLLKELDLVMDLPVRMGQLGCNVVDLTAFLTPLMIGIREQKALKGSMMDEEHQKEQLLKLEIEYLHLMYNELLNKMDECLENVQKSLADKDLIDGDIRHLAWSQYLSILKELLQISKLYDDAEEQLWKVLVSQRSTLCLLIVQYAKRTDDHRWILKRKCVTNFESRRHLALMMLPELKEDYEELHEMLIDRSHLLAESFEYIGRADPESLHAGLFMEFKNEEATGPGVLREWFCLVCQQIFNPQNALFAACPNDRRRFFPNPASEIHPLHLEYFTFSGRVIALALMHRVQVGIVFDRVFFMQLAGKYITLEDIKDADPCLYNSCKQIMEMSAGFIDSDALGLTFVREMEELGQRKVVELCPDGKNTVVNSKNREKYVDLLIQHHFVTSISEQVSHFAKGFADILSDSSLHQFFFQSLDLEDLDWMLNGSEDAISVEDWKAHTDYSGYNVTDPQISWFWEIVEGMTAEQRKVLLFFWTSVKYLPVEGFRRLASRLSISRSHERDDRLPSSHTCFYRLCFPAYPSMAVMRDRIGVITQEHVGYSFGKW